MNQAVARDQYSAGGLALLVHLFLFAALMFGVSWKHLPEVPVYADLWRTLPDQPIPPPEPIPVVPVPAVAAPPVVKPAPPPPSEPAPPPKATPPAKLAEPDIALKEKKKKAAALRREEQLRLEEEHKRQEADKKQRLEDERKHTQELNRQRLEEERKRLAAEQRRKLEDELQRAELERLAQEEKQLQKRREDEIKAAEARRLAREKARKEMEALMASEMADDLVAEARGIRQQAAVAARLRLVDDFKSRIQLKIKGLLINPPNLRGLPEAVYRVELLPNGDVVRAVLLRSSGQSGYDRAVESAILKASPLPLPSDREAAAAFRDGLELKFRPDAVADMR